MVYLTQLHLIRDMIHGRNSISNTVYLVLIQAREISNLQSTAHTMAHFEFVPPSSSEFINIIIYVQVH